MIVQRSWAWAAVDSTTLLFVPCAHAPIRGQWLGCAGILRIFSQPKLAPASPNNNVPGHHSVFDINDITSR